MDNSTENEMISLVPVQWDWLSVVQLTLAITGILGNSLVIHIFRVNRQLKGKPTNVFIAALAVADLITSIAIIPIPELSRVPQNTGGKFYCKLVHSSNVMWISIVASIGTLTTLSVERYVAVGFPRRYKRIFSQKNMAIIIICIWLFGFALNTFGYYEVFIVSGQCEHIPVSDNFQKFLGISLFLVKYLLPMIIMLATNIRTMQLLQKQAKSLLGNDSKNSPAVAMLRASRRVVYMLLVVIIVFIICWTPDQLAFLGFNLKILPSEFLWDDIVYRALVVLGYFNSCLNPAIYIITNRNFRQAFYKLFQSRKRPLASSTQTKSTALFDVVDFDTSVTIINFDDGTAMSDDMKNIKKTDVTEASFRKSISAKLKAYF